MTNDFDISDNDMHQKLNQHEKIMADNSQEQLRGAIEFARDLLKSITLINGGAAIALLAFTGNVWSNSDKAKTIVGIEHLKIALAAFTAGVLFAVLSSVFGYFAQRSFYEAGSNVVSKYIYLNISTLFAKYGEEKTNEDKFLKALDIDAKEFHNKSEALNQSANRKTRFALALFLFSLGSFITGVIFSILAFF